ncbi:hypothetical protein [Sphingomonas faeni]|nr:hypothetical protein [Sphingomonas faeni]
MLIAIIVLLVGALAFMLGQRSRDNGSPTATSSVLPATPQPTLKAPPMPVRRPEAPAPTPSPDAAPLVLNAGELTPLKGGKPFTEKFDDTSLTFLPTKDFRKLIAYRNEAIDPKSDGTCTKVYTMHEKVGKIDYAWDFVIKSFRTWNDKEGQQEYMIDETLLPHAFQGSLHDIVREGRTVTVEKQRCGMGQVESFVSIKP